MVDTRQIHPRLDHQLLTEITEFAKRTERTQNGAVVYLLRKGLASEKTETKENGMEGRVP